MKSRNRRKIQISGALATFLILIAVVSCGSEDDGIKFPVEYKGAFTERYEVTALWNTQGTCVQDVVEEATLRLEPDGSAVFTHPDRSVTFKHRIGGDCEYIKVEDSGKTKTSAGSHDSKGTLTLTRESAREHTRHYTGSFTKDEATFSGDYTGEDSIDGWNWSIRITASFQGNMVE